MIHLCRLTKRFGSFTAVDRLDLEIPAGKVTAFLGPNGAGKTTTIKMMTGLLFPTSGDLLIDGDDFCADPIRVKKIMSYVPDFPFVYERLTGREFLCFVSAVHGIPQNESERRIEHFLDRFDIRALQHRLILHYSHGMRQRLIFCAALIKHPRILIVDEPMVGLDPRTARIFKDVVRETAARGAVVFLSTHQLSVAEELADHIAIIHQGRIRARGTLESLLENRARHPNLEHFFLELTRT
jgi:ABC-2 type transport system ATP-binding protein